MTFARFLFYAAAVFIAVSAVLTLFSFIKRQKEKAQALLDENLERMAWQDEHVLDLPAASPRLLN